MARSRSKTQQVILDAAAANGAGTAMRVVGYSVIQLQIGSTGSGAATLKIQGSQSGTNPYDDPPDFSAGQSPTNHWDYVSSKDLESGTSVAGTTGYTFAGTDADNVRNILVNCEGLEWLDVIVSGYSAGAITVKGFGYSVE